MMAEVVLDVDHLTKSFRLHHEKANSLKQLIAARVVATATTSSSR